MATDPICHMQVDEASALSATVEGQTYYFCSEHCRQKFLDQASGRRQPADGAASGMTPSPACCAHDEAMQEELRPKEDKPVVPPASGYYCPMDPGVHSDRPGAC